MLQSMTGYGEARLLAGPVQVQVVIRSVNNKYFKLTLKAPEGWSKLEVQVEKELRERVRRGSVHTEIRLSSPQLPSGWQIDAKTLKSYVEQLATFRTVEMPSLARSASGSELGLPMAAPNWGELLSLPGVVKDTAAQWGEAEDHWPEVAKALREALVQLERTRQQEGAALCADLRLHCGQIQQELAAVAQLAPLVTENYSKRLLERVNKLLADLGGGSVTTAEVVREVCLFADRADISEELVRLQTHLKQFLQLLDATESSGRQLEFVTQEMFREANTIGSKANDPRISLHVVTIKTCIERLREMIQNVE